MKRYYDIVLTNRDLNRRVYYLANSFSVSDDRILNINSIVGNIVVQIEDEEELTINELTVREN